MSQFSPFGVGSAGGFVASVLPIELLAFSGKYVPPFGGKGAGGNLLTWTTANEVNNKGFQVERAPQPPKGALLTWEILGFVNAKGKGSSYDFTDVTPPLGAGGLYRLRQIDNDGKETLSKVISIIGKGNIKLKVYPSVTMGILTVETSETADYQVFNLLGQQVLNGKTHPLGVGGLDVSALPQGTYVFKIGTEQAKFVKQ